MGRDRRHPLREDWESVKDDVMRFAVLEKFKQNDNAREVLLATGNRQLIEHTKNDNYWADGGDGTGKNMLGIILMETRKNLSKNP
ncbi:Swarming motility protein ybiA [Serratia fonticola]|nr:Swarming motility protein ybiA [Serratia fonticola]CAI1112716.1 Swarming motility protein ybiA [Serratia fonticola]CAI1742913.1 Swarming motility protein ybiA [Serratia fonticola]CAI1877176.1 Swarming motility protein ybiA [Serratia fonticola]CAI1984471.1 Swarming motility protein ybiA [Serratia fonticola]